GGPPRVPPPQVPPQARAAETGPQHRPTSTKEKTMTANPDGPPLGVAVLGHAFMGKAHSNAWRNVSAFYPGGPAVAQRVLAGRDPHSVAADAGRYGWAEGSTDWRAVLARDDVQIVDICTPGHLHAELAVAALEAGKHVIVEKPLANSVAEAELMAAAARTARA